jgi:hypothetical protein
MATYFVFSDESGQYQEYYRDKGAKYFVRSALLFNSENWMALKNDIDILKKDTGIPIHTEFKWRYLNLIRLYQGGKLKINGTEDWCQFKDHNVISLIDFIRRIISLFHRYADSKTIFTFTENVPVKMWKILLKGIIVNQGESANPTIHHIYKWHLQELMQRVEMEIQGNNNLAILFFDQDSKDTEKHLRNSYHEIYHNGDFIKKYLHIKDSICFEHSHQSVGIQIADYIAGIFNAFLKSETIGCDLMECILPILRKSPSGDFLGYGIREVPKDENKRQWLREKMTPFFATDL